MKGRAGGRWRLPILLLVLVAGLVGSVLMRKGRQGAEWEWYNRGIDAGARGDILAAQGCFERAVAINPRFTQAYDWLVQSYIGIGQPRKALQALHEMYTVDPNYPHLSILYAEATMEVDNVTMLRWARAAVLQEPRSPRARALFALGLARSGDSRDALLELGVAERLSPSPVVSKSLKAGESLASKPKELARLIAPLVLQTPLE